MWRVLPKTSCAWNETSGRLTPIHRKVGVLHLPEGGLEEDERGISIAIKYYNHEASNPLFKAFLTASAQLPIQSKQSHLLPFCNQPPPVGCCAQPVQTVPPFRSSYPAHEPLRDPALDVFRLLLSAFERKTIKRYQLESREHPLQHPPQSRFSCLF